MTEKFKIKDFINVLGKMDPESEFYPTFFLHKNSTRATLYISEGEFGDIGSVLFFEETKEREKMKYRKFTLKKFDYRTTTELKKSE